MTTAGKEDLLLKTLSFLSFQISQAISVMADRRPLGEEVVVFEAANQWSRTLGRPTPMLLRRSGQESQEAAAVQMRLEKRHSKSKCLAVSGELRHSWQVG
jgi:hypothetical protein